MRAELEAAQQEANTANETIRYWQKKYDREFDYAERKKQDCEYYKNKLTGEQERHEKELNNEKQRRKDKVAQLKEERKNLEESFEQLKKEHNNSRELLKDAYRFQDFTVTVELSHPRNPRTKQFANGTLRSVDLREFTMIVEAKMADTHRAELTTPNAQMLNTPAVPGAPVTAERDNSGHADSRRQLFTTRR